VVAKIRDVTSYGMLCSESELNLSEESDGITELSPKKYEKSIGKSYFSKSNSNLIDLSIPIPNAYPWNFVGSTLTFFKTFG